MDLRTRWAFSLSNGCGISMKDQNGRHGSHPFYPVWLSAPVKLKSFSFLWNSMNWLFINLFKFKGPIVSLLINKYGCRMVTILGTILTFIGLGISTFVQNITVLYFTIGVLAGTIIRFLFVLKWNWTKTWRNQLEIWMIFDWFDRNFLISLVFSIFSVKIPFDFDFSIESSNLQLKLIDSSSYSYNYPSNLINSTIENLIFESIQSIDHQLFNSNDPGFIIHFLFNFKWNWSKTWQN